MQKVQLDSPALAHKVGIISVCLTAISPVSKVQLKALSYYCAVNGWDRKEQTLIL